MARAQASIQWNGRRIWTSRGRRHAQNGLIKSLELILAESNKLVPLDEGTLERSANWSIDGDNLRGTVYYNTPYAMRQHEELSWKHAPGRQAKFLETAMNNNREKALLLMRNELSMWTRGG